MSLAVGSLITLDAVLTEGTDGQCISVHLKDPATGAVINTASIVSITGTLRSLDTEVALFTGVNLITTGRSSYPGTPTLGTVRITFTAADAAASGTRVMQTRELTLATVHSVNKVFNCAVRFKLVNLRDVATP